MSKKFNKIISFCIIMLFVIAIFFIKRFSSPLNNESESFYGVYEIKEFYPDAKTWGNKFETKK